MAALRQGQQVLLVSSSANRYLGTLSGVDPQRNIVTLTSVSCFGSGLDCGVACAPGPQYYAHIEFCGAMVRMIPVSRSAADGEALLSMARLAGQTTGTGRLGAYGIAQRDAAPHGGRPSYGGYGEGYCPAGIAGGGGRTQPLLGQPRQRRQRGAEGQGRGRAPSAASAVPPAASPSPSPARSASPAPAAAAMQGELGAPPQAGESGPRAPSGLDGGTREQPRSLGGRQTTAAGGARLWCSAPDIVKKPLPPAQQVRVPVAGRPQCAASAPATRAAAQRAPSPEEADEPPHAAPDAAPQAAGPGADATASLGPPADSGAEWRVVRKSGVLPDSERVKREAQRREREARERNRQRRELRAQDEQQRQRLAQWRLQDEQRQQALQAARKRRKGTRAEGAAEVRVVRIEVPDLPRDDQNARRAFTSATGQAVSAATAEQAAKKMWRQSKKKREVEVRDENDEVHVFATSLWASAAIDGVRGGGPKFKRGKRHKQPHRRGTWAGMLEEE
eukprot:TRINITY_DN6030_c0_g1_i1.p1 TRINITY_DN6030_c0_g1~~TRINITY_DN6030_c0_g1_i1.p1  ORF type:complete len:534 (+),score=134.68 TRINITY_DN6030_c0_g1_i1:91-1602(+)